MPSKGYDEIWARITSRERWGETPTWMQKHHKLHQFDAAERRQILDYLAANLGPRQRALRLASYRQDQIHGFIPVSVRHSTTRL